MNVFLTGGTGFLGGHLAEVLAGAGHALFALTRPSSRTAVLERTGARPVPGSLDDPDALAPVLAECDAVVHAAGLVKAVDPADFARVNVDGAGRLAASFARHGRGRAFVLVSSIAAQGPGDGPHARNADLPEAPVTAYGRSKLGGERAVLAAAGDRLDVTVIRPPMIYGPGDIEFLKMIQVADRTGLLTCGNRHQEFSVIHARDCAGAVLAALAVPHATPACLPVDDGRVHTWPGLAASLSRALGRRVRAVQVPRPVLWTVAACWETLARVTGRAAILGRDKLHEAAPRWWVCGPEAARRHLDWSASIDVDAGLAETVARARAEGSLTARG